MDTVTKNIANYVRERRINISAMARDTGIAYAALYASLVDEKRKREIRGKELLLISRFLGVNPMDFADKPEEVI